MRSSKDEVAQLKLTVFATVATMSKKIIFNWKANFHKVDRIPANIRLDEDVFHLRLQKTSSRRLQDVLIKTNMFALALRLQDVLVKTNIFVLAIRLQDVFKTFSRRLQDVLQKRLQGIFKTSSRRFEDAKTSSWRLQNIFITSCKNVLKTYSKRLQDILKTSSKRLAKISSRIFQDVSSS